MTPIEKYIYALDEAILGMKIGQAKEVAVQCKELAKVFLSDEKRAIRDAFDEGEMNVWNKERDGGFEYEDGTDYFDRNYKHK